MIRFVRIFKEISRAGFYEITCKLERLYAFSFIRRITRLKHRQNCFALHNIYSNVTQNIWRTAWR